MEERELHLSHSEYATLLELQARYAEWNNNDRVIAQAASVFGLRPFTHYRIIVDR